VSTTATAKRVSSITRKKTSYHTAQDKPVAVFFKEKIEACFNSCQVQLLES
jgi:hypothetical protein